MGSSGHKLNALKLPAVSSQRARGGRVTLSHRSSLNQTEDTRTKGQSGRTTELASRPGGVPSAPAGHEVSSCTAL